MVLEKYSSSSHLENDIQCVHYIMLRIKNITGRKMINLEFQVALVESLVLGHIETRRKEMEILGPDPARLTKRHP